MRTCHGAAISWSHSFCFGFFYQHFWGVAVLARNLLLQPNRLLLRLPPRFFQPTRIWCFTLEADLHSSFCLRDFSTCHAPSKHSYKQMHEGFITGSAGCFSTRNPDRMGERAMQWPIRGLFVGQPRMVHGVWNKIAVEPFESFPFFPEWSHWPQVVFMFDFQFRCAKHFNALRVTMHDFNWVSLSPSQTRSYSTSPIHLESSLRKTLNIALQEVDAADLDEATMTAFRAQCEGMQAASKRRKIQHSQTFFDW